MADIGATPALFQRLASNGYVQACLDAPLSFIRAAMGMTVSAWAKRSTAAGEPAWFSAARSVVSRKSRSSCRPMAKVMSLPG